MSPKVFRHSWLAIAAPFVALSIARFADGNWESASLLATIALGLVSIEVFVVLRARLRSPFYRLRNFKSDRLEMVDELRRFQAEVSGHCAKIVSDSLNLLDVVARDENNLRFEPATLANVGDKRRLRKQIQTEEKELCELLSSFRGFFYAPD